MEKIKSLISPGKSQDDGTMYNTPSKGETAGATGKVTGQGTHFGSSDSPSAETPTTAAEPSTSASTSAPLTEPTATDRTTTEPTATGSFPSTEPSTDGRGQAAIGNSSTYSSSALGSGEPTSSVVDPRSSDPTTFKKPETSTIGAAGVGSGAALAAASKAFDKDGARTSDMPGAFPAEGSSNPYANSAIDSRVDGPSSTHTSSAPKASALGTSAAASAMHPHESSSTTQAPTSLTSTTNPAGRSSDYSTAAATRAMENPPTVPAAEPDQDKTSLKTKVLGALGIGAAGAAAKERRASNSGIDSSSTAPSGHAPSHHRKESIPTTAYPSGTFDSPRAVAPPVGGQAGSARGRSGSTDQFADNPYSSLAGHGGTTAAAAGAIGGAGLAAESTDGRRRSVQEINEATRRDSLRMQASGAYSGGFAAYEGRDRSQERRASGQLGAAALPLRKSSHVPGDATIPSTMHEITPATGEESHTGRDAALAAGAVGAAGLGAHELGKNSGADIEPGHRGIGSTVHDMTTTSTSQPAGETDKGKERDESHLGRDAAIGAGGVGAGALAEHELSKKEAEKEHKALAKQREKDAKAAEKEQKKHEKQEHKQAEKEERAEKKAHKHEGKEHEKEALAAGAGTAAIGTGAYEAEKHAGGDSVDKDAAVREHQAQMKQDYENRYAEVKQDQEQRIQARIAEEKAQRGETEGAGEGHGKEVAAGAVGAGALGAGAHEAEKHEKTKEGEGIPGTAVGSGPGALEHPTTSAEPSHSHSHGKEALAGAGVAGAGAGAYEAEKHHHDSTESGHLSGLAAADAKDREVYGTGKLHKEPKEKKPSILRRIFKRRKNKDTGESEDYSSDEERDGSAAAVAPATAAEARHEKHQHQHQHGMGHSDGTMPATDSSGYSLGNTQDTSFKPSYSPFARTEKVQDQVAKGTVIGGHGGTQEGQVADDTTGVSKE